MRRLRFVPWTAAALVLTAGCSHRPSIIGTWTGQITLPGSGGTVPSEITLRPDGTFHKKGGTQAEYSGTYTVKDHTLTETFSSYSVEGQVMAIPADTPNVETDTFTIKDNTLTLTPQGGGPPTLLTRQEGK